MKLKLAARAIEPEYVATLLGSLLGNPGKEDS